MEYIAAIISAIGTIIVAWFAYNQKTKDKLTDLKIERFKQEETAKNIRRNYNSAVVFGELWNVLYQLKADRVYIVQPHPLYEVKRKGVEGMRERIHNLRMSEVANFATMLSKNLFLYITDIDAQVEDKYAKAILSSCGCEQAVIKRLNDNRYDWVGSIFCEFTRPIKSSEEEAHKILHEAAMNIQYILPEYK